MPSPPTPIEFNQIDKVYHLVAFAGFTFVFCLAFRRLNRLAIFTFSALLGITIEVIQFYMPSRGFSFGDMVADIIGVLIGLFVAKILLKDKR